MALPLGCSLGQVGAAVRTQDRQIRPHVKVLAIAAAHVCYQRRGRQALDELPHLKARVLLDHI